MLPDAGDIAWVELDPVLGSEQSGRRPALILTSRSYHEQSWRAVMCPITSRDKPWPFHVVLPGGLRTSGVVLVDQIRTVDRRHRVFEVVERAPDGLVDEVRGRVCALLGIDPIGLTPDPPER